MRASLCLGLVIETDRGTVMLKDQDDAGIVFRERSNPAIEQIVRRRNAPTTPDARSMFQLQIEDFAQACNNVVLALWELHNPTADSRDFRNILLLDYYETGRSPSGKTAIELCIALNKK